MLASASRNILKEKSSDEVHEGGTMNVSHVHVGVKDLSEALRWLDRVWEVRPTFQNERMASVLFGEFTIFLDASPMDAPLTIGFDSNNCDVDFRAAE
jgi:hypothetical protein